MKYHSIFQFFFSLLTPRGGGGVKAVKIIKYQKQHQIRARHHQNYNKWHIARFFNFFFSFFTPHKGGGVGVRGAPWWWNVQNNIRFEFCATKSIAKDISQDFQHFLNFCSPPSPPPAWHKENVKEVKYKKTFRFEISATKDTTNNKIFFYFSSIFSRRGGVV